MHHRVKKLIEIRIECRKMFQPHSNRSLNVKNFVTVLLKVKRRTELPRQVYLSLVYTKNVDMATMMTCFSRAYIYRAFEWCQSQFSKSNRSGDRAIWNFYLRLAVTQSHIENVAMATIMTNFDRAHREFSNGVSTKSLSWIEVVIKWFESFTLKNTKNGWEHLVHSM